ncbi:MAG TPA: MBL fold metallo-hydrolase [bacterium]|nr:MBL fold metallo-hydrolase [bacterium]
MNLEFHGAVRTVTGSAHLLRIGDRNFLIDCGMFQGPRYLEERNQLPFYFDPNLLDGVLLTHAHIDHSGLIPKLYKDGYRGPVHATRATVDLAQIMLLDSAHIAERDAIDHNRRARRKGHSLIKPIFTIEEAGQSLEQLVSHKYEDMIELAPGITAVFRDAGHILGSAFIEMTVRSEEGEKRITFSGDVGNKDQALIRDPFKPNPTDVLLIESTYGDRLHKPRTDTLAELADVLLVAWQDRGNVIIPSFAVGRTQEILYRLRELSEEGRLPGFNVYVDSPLAINATEIVRNNPQCYDDETIFGITGLGNDPLLVPNLRFTRDARESMAINEADKPSIIISASGMCTAGRILHHLKHNLWRRECHIVFVGFQAEGSLGRMLVDGAPRVKIFGQEVVAAAHIHTIGGLSAHADRDGLLEWMAPALHKHTKVFVVHGEEEAAASFAAGVKKEFGNPAVVPTWHEIARL